jgi:hypothetical protein
MVTQAILACLDDASLYFACRNKQIHRICMLANNSRNRTDNDTLVDWKLPFIEYGKLHRGCETHGLLVCGIDTQTAPAPFAS